MLILLNQAWPWIIIGMLLICWGLFSLQIPSAQWIRVFISIFFSNLGDRTRAEKREIAAEPLEDAVSNNAGCALMLLGLVCFSYGIVRWIG